MYWSGHVRCQLFYGRLRPEGGLGTPPYPFVSAFAVRKALQVSNFSMNVRYTPPQLASFGSDSRVNRSCEPIHKALVNHLTDDFVETVEMGKKDHEYNQ